MSLTCGCDFDYYPDPGSIVYYNPSDYSTLTTKRRQRCCSCKTLIDIGATVAETTRYKVPDGDVEERIYGEDGEIPRASLYLCETCADLYFSLDAIGYCIDPTSSQHKQLEEHTNTLLRSVPRGVITHAN